MNKRYKRNHISEYAIMFYRSIIFDLPEDKRSRDGVLDWIVSMMLKPKDQRHYSADYYKRLGASFSKLSDKNLAFIMSDINKYTYLYALRPACLKVDGDEGYEVSALIKYLRKVRLYDEWIGWFYGKSYGIIDGKVAVYKEDLMKFLEKQKAKK